MDKQVPNPGEIVHWKWLGRVLDGVVLSVHPEKTQIISKGKLITRNGTPDNPAVVIKYKNGNEVLKYLSELII